MSNVSADMDDFSAMTASEMFARRDVAQAEISSAIGKLVFTYSRFVTGLHLCVAWLNDGKDLDSYPEIAEDLAVADLLKRIERHARTRLGGASTGFKKYKGWVRRAHQLREVRNVVMHSRWGIEPYGRHAIAISTPIFIEPMKEIIFTADRLGRLCQTCERLACELNDLRKEYPL